MFNLLISHDPEAWENGSHEFDKNRVAIEYTADEISERYKDLSEEHIEELKGFPALFVTEREQTPSKIGWITQIKINSPKDLFPNVLIEFEFDPNFSELPIGTIKDLKVDFKLGRMEIYRTHWAIKDVNLFDVLLENELITQAQLDASQSLIRTSFPDPEPLVPEAGGFNTSQVFIVHGHDHMTQLKVAEFVSDLGLEPIVLHQQASGGRTIIEKLEHYTNVGFAIILYTPCDTGVKAGELTHSYRARQNVVFEHGYLMSKLGRSRVFTIVKEGVEFPNDVSGIVYIPMDENGSWEEKIKTEMKNLDYPV